MSDIEIDIIPNIPADPEEEIIPYVGPPKLQPLNQIITGEEQEIILKQFTCKVYRFRDDEWKQRGQGIIKFLKHKQTNICRLVMIQEGTFFIRISHIINTTLQKSMLHEYGYEWEALDNSDLQEKQESFAIKFKNNEDYKQFEIVYNECRTNNINED